MKWSTSNWILILGTKTSLIFVNLTKMLKKLEIEDMNFDKKMFEAFENLIFKTLKILTSLIS